jgi:hypothetical protein
VVHRTRGVRWTGPYIKLCGERDELESAVVVEFGGAAEGCGLCRPGLTYGRLGAHVIRHEISVEGPLREYYLAGLLDTQDPTSWETEIGWPIFRSDPERP